LAPERYDATSTSAPQPKTSAARSSSGETPASDG
jgi:hypothetical protein